MVNLQLMETLLQRDIHMVSLFTLTTYVHVNTQSRSTHTYRNIELCKKKNTRQAILKHFFQGGKLYLVFKLVCLKINFLISRKNMILTCDFKQGA